MKIDELSIDHNALRLIEAATTDAWGIEADAVVNKEIVMYINGVMDMVKALKEVLKV